MNGHSFHPEEAAVRLLKVQNLTYSEDLIDNHAASDDIIIQFISENQFVIGQAITETWRTLSEGKMGDNNQPIISMTTFYTGFIRRDNRGWLGFHDGISNMNEEAAKK